MDFTLSYGGSPGNISATVTLVGGSVIATASGLKDGRAASRFAQRAARDYRAENTPEATSYESVSVSGSSTFSL